ncbi:Activator of Hsp90 ATPase homolog 1-like protein [Fictibacillus solisalsi]|uniref:Activator of Hsp90 ATPase homolog 1-like protein n=1 Tax=Fictibacillus solisalsi TaxID=459525 RepID=A0A1H0BQV4_9BACL|nr:PDZ domain-containing protein [Fictibacillus solisalsi]SDN47996.1 Activator of Hsp90 ATPase homolog 1-like protein [Fictibacillus solisalsi]
MNKQTYFQIETYLEAPIEQVWWSVSTPEGMNTFLTYKSGSSGDASSPKVGDRFFLNYGDIENEQIVLEYTENQAFKVFDSYKSISPDGSVQEFKVVTRTTLEQLDETFVKLTLSVNGFSLDTFGQWFKECMKFGWQRSMMSLKSVLELGMDLRTPLFSYPRLGILNCTINEEQRVLTGCQEAGNYLLEVFPNSPASRAGLNKGDVILSVGGKPTGNYEEFVKTISSYGEKLDNVQITFFSDGQVRTSVVNFSLEDIFTGLVDTENESFKDIKEKREMLAKQRSSSDSLWTGKGDDQHEHC